MMLFYVSILKHHTRSMLTWIRLGVPSSRLWSWTWKKALLPERAYGFQRWGGKVLYSVYPPSESKSSTSILPPILWIWSTAAMAKFRSCKWLNDQKFVKWNDHRLICGQCLIPVLRWNELDHRVIGHLPWLWCSPSVRLWTAPHHRGGIHMESRCSRMSSLAVLHIHCNKNPHSQLHFLRTQSLWRLAGWCWR